MESMQSAPSPAPVPLAQLIRRSTPPALMPDLPHTPADHPARDVAFATWTLTSLLGVLIGTAIAKYG